MPQQVIYSNFPLYLHMHFQSSKVISLFMRLSHFWIFFQATIHTNKVTLNTFRALEHQTLFQGNYAWAFNALHCEWRWKLPFPLKLHLIWYWPSLLGILESKVSKKKSTDSNSRTLKSFMNLKFLLFWHHKFEWIEASFLSVTISYKFGNISFKEWFLFHLSFNTSHGCHPLPQTALSSDKYPNWS